MIGYNILGSGQYKCEECGEDFMECISILDVLVGSDKFCPYCGVGLNRLDEEENIDRSEMECIDIESSRKEE